jgi:hypothetical protein
MVRFCVRQPTQRLEIKDRARRLKQLAIYSQRRKPRADHQPGGSYSDAAIHEEIMADVDDSEFRTQTRAKLLVAEYQWPIWTEYFHTKAFSLW